MKEKELDANVIPEGFEALYRESPFVKLIGPIYQRPTENFLIIGLRVLEKHCNVRGDLHGGVVSSLADMAMGYNVAYTENPPISAVTATLTVDYVGRVKQGDWLEVHVDIQKKGKRLSFVNCLFYVDGNSVARANAVFHMLSKNVQTSF